MQLVKYDEACRAVAQCNKIDEVQQIKNKADALRAYAKQAKNRELEIDASEIRVRAERRVGQLVSRIKLETDFQPRKGRTLHPGFSYADVGIDRDMRKVCGRLALLPDDKFESAMSTWRNDAETSKRRITLPLPLVRIPRMVKHNRVGSAKRMQKHIEMGPLDGFCALDGRAVADWRSGELKRLEQVTAQQLQWIKSLRASLPVANADPFTTMRDMFSVDALTQLLTAC